MSFDTAYLVRKVLARGMIFAVREPYLSIDSSDFSSFKVLKISLPRRSGNFAIKCKSEATIDSLGCILYSAADCLNFGNNPKARRNVPITLVVMVDSYPATILKYLVIIPAFSSTASSRGSLLALVQNDLIDSYDCMSRSHTSMLVSARPVLARMDCFAASPLAWFRTARIRRAALRRERCRAASSPRPVFEPVTMIVWPEKSLVGLGSLTNNCE
jgi:hypothetical protein